jgi:hypothetical protein
VEVFLIALVRSSSRFLDGSRDILLNFNGSDSRSSTTPTVATPSNLVAKAVAFDTIRLSWIDHSPLDAGTKFQIQRSTSPYFTAADTLKGDSADNTVAATSLGGGVFTFDDKGALASDADPNNPTKLQPGVNYSYRVVAVKPIPGQSASAYVTSNPSYSAYATITPVNLTIDSNNDGGISWTDDAIEDDAGTPGKYLQTNDEFARGFDLDGLPSFNADDYGDAARFAPATVQVPDWVDLNGAVLKFTYSGSAPSASIAGDLRLWLSGTSARGMSDYIVPDQAYTPAQLGMTKTNRSATIYVEALNGSATIGDKPIAVSLSPIDSESAAKSVDAVHLTALTANLTIDSNNNDGLTPPSTDARQDDQIEAEADLPGKIFMINDDDSNGDGVADYADGFPVSGLAVNPAPLDEQFIPVQFTLSPLIDPATAQLSFTYSGSDPAGVSVSQDPANPIILPGGDLRLWKLDGSQQRQLSDYIVPGQSYAASDLGFASSTLTKTFWLEGIRPAAVAGGEAIMAQVSSGALPLFLADRVSATSAKIHIIDARAFGPTMTRVPIGRTENRIDSDLTDKGFKDKNKNGSYKDSEVAGAVTDGSSLLVLQVSPKVDGATLRISEKSSNVAGNAYKVGSAWTTTNGADVPQLPAGDESEDIDTGQSAEVKAGPNGTAYYRPPNNFLLVNDPSVEFGEVEIHLIKDGNDSGSEPMLLRRPPLLLVHGFLGDRDSFPESATDSKNNLPVSWKSEGDPLADGVPVTTIVNKVSYSGTNTKGLAENFAVIPETIHSWLQSIRNGTETTKFPGLQNKKFAVTRVDVVAHSMGGVLVKWFVANFGGGQDISRDPLGDVGYGKFSTNRDPKDQYLRSDNFGGGDIRRFVSVGSPFQGSPIANLVFPKLTPLPGNIADLRKYVKGTNPLTQTLREKAAQVFFGGNADGPYDPPTAVADLQAKDAQGKGPSRALTILNKAWFPADRGAVDWYAIGAVAVADSTTLKDQLVWDILFAVIKDAVEVNLSNKIPPDSDVIVPLSSTRDGIAAGASNVEALQDLAHVKIPTKFEGLLTSTATIDSVRKRLTDSPAAGKFAPLAGHPYPS